MKIQMTRVGALSASAVCIAVLGLSSVSLAEEADGTEKEKAPEAVASTDEATKTASASEASGAKPYQVECDDAGKCKVDKLTFKGWRTFHGFCHTCHAQDAVGSTFAPSLLIRTKGMEKARFVEVITNGFQGQVGVMPAWKDNPNVMPKMDELWAYLQARADGALGTGRPGKL